MPQNHPKNFREKTIFFDTDFTVLALLLRYCEPTSSIFD